MGNIKASTQQHLDIVDIKKNTVILKNSSAAYILETSAINFDLLSLVEQDAAISAYSSLINSLTFPIQVTIRSKRMDISSYIARIIEHEKKQTNEKIKAQIQAYRSFILDELISKEEVLDKKFYVAIPYGGFGLPQGGIFTTLKGILNVGSVDNTRVNVDKILQEAISELEPKKDFLIKEFSRIGIRAKHLNTHEITKLFYEIYNSEITQHQKFNIGNSEEYTTALVEPKII